MPPDERIFAVELCFARGQEPYGARMRGRVEDREVWTPELRAHVPGPGDFDTFMQRALSHDARPWFVVEWPNAADPDNPGGLRSIVSALQVTGYRVNGEVE